MESSTHPTATSSSRRSSGQGRPKAPHTSAARGTPRRHRHHASLRRGTALAPQCDLCLAARSGRAPAQCSRQTRRVLFLKFRNFSSPLRSTLPFRGRLGYQFFRALLPEARNQSPDHLSCQACTAHDHVLTGKRPFKSHIVQRLRRAELTSLRCVWVMSEESVGLRRKEWDCAQLVWAAEKGSPR